MAMRTFETLHLKPKGVIEVIRKDLLAYCKLDTYAMVKIFSVMKVTRCMTMNVMICIVMIVMACIVMIKEVIWQLGQWTIGYVVAVDIGVVQER